MIFKFIIFHFSIGLHPTVNKNIESINNLFQVILSNGFPRLRIFTAISIPLLDSSDTWTGSPVLRALHLNMKTAYDYEKLLSVCPNLRRFTSNSTSWINLTKGTFTFLLLTLDKNIY